LLGYETEDMKLHDVKLTLAPDETLAVYTDGITEATIPERKEMFGEERLRGALGGDRAKMSLEACADYTRAVVEEFIGEREMQDDMTLFLLRRVS
jgi:sigma-B regulation protein RsbU (phosphoserine phosphatase)